jgi:hypothetical protein
MDDNFVDFRKDEEDSSNNKKIDNNCSSNESLSTGLILNKNLFLDNIRRDSFSNRDVPKEQSKSAGHTPNTYATSREKIMHNI